MWFPTWASTALNWRSCARSCLRSSLRAHRYQQCQTRHLNPKLVDLPRLFNPHPRHLRCLMLTCWTYLPFSSSLRSHYSPCPTRRLFYYEYAFCAPSPCPSLRCLRAYPSFQAGCLMSLEEEKICHHPSSLFFAPRSQHSTCASDPWATRIL